MKVELIKTDDGSHSLFREDLNETYHSTHGAIAESLHVYIKEGLERILKSDLPVKILEVGFGTGLNALLTTAFHFESPMVINYDTLEPYPLPKEIYDQINYPETINYSRSQADFLKMHELSSKEEHVFNETFCFTKHLQKLEEFETTKTFTLIYFDAFAPNKQSDMWELTQFEKLYALLEPGGALTTYCAQGQFKRTLKQVGFEVLEVDGPPGKKQMTVGVKPHK